LKLGVAIFLTFLGLYLATGSRERPWGDANPVYQVAENLVGSGSLHVDVRWPYDAEPGRHGKHYAINPFLTSVIHVPGVVLRRVVKSVAPALDPLILPIASHVGPAALGALACLLYFALARRFVSTRAATLATVAVGAATTVWVYARYPYSEVLQAACFTGFALALARAVEDPGAGAARALGLWAGLLVNAKLVYFVALPGAAAIVAWRLRREPRRMLPVAGWAAAVFVPLVLVIPWYNWARWGSPLVTGYGDVAAAAAGKLWVGLHGLFLSPGKSVFLYSPPLLAALLGAAALARRSPLLVWGVALSLAPVVAVYASFIFWAGDYAWGPRYLVFCVPVLALPLAFVAERALERRWLPAAALVVTLACGAGVQVLGNAYYWDHWVRISKEAAAGWLGKPNRAGAFPPDRGGICDACFEDMYAQQWLPPFQPIAGHLWLLRHTPFGHDYKTAEQDAPWRLYTKIHVKIDEQWYRRARIDWWGIDWVEHERKGAMWLVLAILSLPLVLGAFLWWRWSRPS
jgi:hypothetical protein